jgi:hypothetical protein
LDASRSDTMDGLREYLSISVSVALGCDQSRLGEREGEKKERSSLISLLSQGVVKEKHDERAHD